MSQMQTEVGAYLSQVVPVQIQSSSSPAGRVRFGDESEFADSFLDSSDGLVLRVPSFNQDALNSWSKRALDVLVAGSAFVALLPAMAIIALVIRATMGGKIIYAHPRVGQGGRIFRCLKFRTMSHESDQILSAHLAANPAAAEEWRINRKLRDDPRVPWIGNVLRKASLDELPQLMNVLRGEMSCVGPRPVVQSELARYGRYAREYVSVRPGMTGLWQVSGRSSLTYRERIALDTIYVRRHSVGFDLQILLRTIPAVLQIDETS